MPHTPERLLTTTARSTFESLALLFAEPAGSAPTDDAPNGAPFGAGAVAARVAFAGSARGAAAGGALAVAVSAEVAAALAENMLGAAESGPEARRDAVGEFANVVCGHVLSAAGGPAAVFRLSAPEPAAPAEAAAAGRWRAWLEVEGGRACVTLEAPEALFAAGGAA
jgi:hypothetical protein